MAERLNAPVLKTGDARAFLSSNLSLSAIPKIFLYFSPFNHSVSKNILYFFMKGFLTDP